MLRFSLSSGSFGLLCKLHNGQVILRMNALNIAVHLSIVLSSFFSRHIHSISIFIVFIHHLLIVTSQVRNVRAIGRILVFFMLGHKIINCNLVFGFKCDSLLESLLKFGSMSSLHCFNEVKMVSFLGGKLVVEAV